MTVVRTDVDLEAIALLKGAHAGPDDGGCIMEWAAYLAGEPWSDAPRCVAPSIRQFCISWNDVLDDESRTRLLKPFLTKVIGTNTGDFDHELRRIWMLTDWQVRTYTPAWLRLAGLESDALALEQLPELTSVDESKAALPTVRAAQERARSRAAAAWAAAGAAARDAAGDAARDAARAAARAAARDAARAAARDAAWAAARAAARDALATTTTELQASAVDLLERMCAVGRS